jgi:putative transposase
MRTKGSAAELEVKRRIACNLLLDGKSRAEVARLVETSWNSVDRWKEALERGGPDALAAKPHPGRPALLSVAQQHRMVRILECGARKAGFDNELWTCPRIAAVIEQRFGVKYDVSHVWRLLHKWGWSCQKPQHRAREQDRAAVDQWRQCEWPRIKKGPS